VAWGASVALHRVGREVSELEFPRHRTDVAPVSTPFALVLVVVAAYLAAHVAADWLGRRLFVTSGAEYLLLGILLGPRVAGVLSPETVESLAPVPTLAIGWIGAFIGARFYIPELVGIPRVAFRTALIEAIGTFAGVTLVETVAISQLVDIPLLTALAPAVALGGIATAASRGTVELVAKRLDPGAPEIAQLRVSVLVSAVVAITTFGLLATIWHPTVMVEGRPMTPTEWFAVTIGIGITGGLLFHLFVGAERDPDRLFISLAGALMLVSGAATYVHVSPLLAALCFGAIVVNTSQSREAIRRALERVEQPLYYLLLIFAGAAWQPSERTWIAAVLVFLVARIVVRLMSARAAAYATDQLPILGRDWGRALLGQGHLALAIALNYVYQGGGPIPYIVFTAAVGSVLLTDLFSPYLAHSVLGPLHARRLRTEAGEPSAPTTGEG
jgi:hypothetical protein